MSMTTHCPMNIIRRRKHRISNLLTYTPDVRFLRAFIVDQSSFLFPTFAEYFFRELSSFSDSSGIILFENVHDFIRDRQRFVL